MTPHLDVGPGMAKYLHMIPAVFIHFHTSESHDITTVKNVSDIKG